MTTFVNRRIDSLLDLLGVTEKLIVREKLAQTSFVEFLAVISGLLSTSTDISFKDLKMPTNGKELQKTVMKISDSLGSNGVDLSVEYEKTLNTVLSNFLNDLEGKVDAQAMANARTFLAQ